MQNAACPPSFVSWAEALSTQRAGEDLCFWPAPKFGQKIGLNLSEDLFFWGGGGGQRIGLNLSDDFFFFWSSTDFGQENRTDFR